MHDWTGQAACLLSRLATTPFYINTPSKNYNEKFQVNRMGKNQAHKAMQRSRGGSTSAAPEELEDGMVRTLSYCLINLFASSFFMFFKFLFSYLSIIFSAVLMFFWTCMLAKFEESCFLDSIPTHKLAGLCWLCFKFFGYLGTPGMPS